MLWSRYIPHFLLLRHQSIQKEVRCKLLTVERLVKKTILLRTNSTANIPVNSIIKNELKRFIKIACNWYRSKIRNNGRINTATNFAEKSILYVQHLLPNEFSTRQQFTHAFRTLEEQTFTRQIVLTAPALCTWNWINFKTCEYIFSKFYWVFAKMKARCTDQRTLESLLLTFRRSAIISHRHLRQ